MKLPNEVVEAMNQFASSYKGAQKVWFDHNYEYIIAKVQYIDTASINGYSFYSPMNNNITITSHNRGVEETIESMVETVWHEYGHLLYENTWVGGFQQCLERELTHYIDRIGSYRTYLKWREVIGSIYDCPVMISDAIGIIMGVKPPYYVGHPEGYPIENLETEVFAEYFAYVMTNDSKMIAKFEDMCPKTARILKRQIYKLFKS